MSEGIAVDSLVGRVFEHVWTEGPIVGRKYSITFRTEMELRWECLEGGSDVKGMRGWENYQLAVIGDGIYQFSWVNRTENLSVTLTYDLNTGKAFGVLINPDDHMILEGTLEEMTRRDP